jgi:hypothetical protein
MKKIEKTLANPLAAQRLRLMFVYGTAMVSAPGAA